MAELGQAGNTTRAGGSSITQSGGGALLDFGSVRVRIPAGARLRLDAVDTHLVRVDTEDGRVDLCVLAAPRSSSLWARMSREVAASQASKGAQVYTEPGEWGDEVLSAKDGRLSRYVATDGPGWMLFGLALGPEETSVELADTLRSIMRSGLVRRGNEPLPEKTPLPMTVPPGLSRSGESSSEASRSDGAEPGADRAGGRQAGPVFQLGPSGTTRRARTLASGLGPAARPGSVARSGSPAAAGSGSVARQGSPVAAGSGAPARSGASARQGAAARSGSPAAARSGSPARPGAPSGPSRDNRAPTASGPASTTGHRNRWIRAGQVSLVLGVVACLAAMVGWLLNGPNTGQVHYTPAVALPPSAAAPAPGDALALGNKPETPGESSAEGQSSGSAPGSEPALGSASEPTRSESTRPTPGQPVSGAASKPGSAPGSRRPARKPTAAQPAAHGAHARGRSGPPAVDAPANSGASVADRRSSGQSERTDSSDDARNSRDDHDGESGSQPHSTPDSTDRRDHSDRDDEVDRPAGPLSGVTRTLDGIGLGLSQ